MTKYTRHQNLAGNTVSEMLLVGYDIMWKINQIYIFIF